MNPLDLLVAAVEGRGTDIAPSYEEYVQLAFAIATDYGEGGRECFHRLCRLSAKYDARNADKLYSSVLGAGNRGSVHLSSAFFLARQHGVEVSESDCLKNAKMQCIGAPHTPTRVPIYADPSGTGAEPADGGEPSDAGEPTDNVEPFQPLPLFEQGTDWPEPIRGLLQRAETAHQRDVLLLGLLNVLGCTMARYVRTLYAHQWVRPVLQTFVVAPPASGKGILSWCRYLVEPLHERIRREVEQEQARFRKERKAYELMGREKATAEEPQPPLNRMFLIPGDNSGTGIAQNVIDSGGNGLILEHEADTIAAAIGADYGKWGQLLRYFFDQGPVRYNRRLNQEYREIQTSLVGVLISGTPAQVPALIPSAENGLFSRPVYYFMPAVNAWRSQFGTADDDIRLWIRDIGTRWMATLEAIARAGTVNFSLTPEQQQRFNALFARLFVRSRSGAADGMSSAAVRLGVNVLRMAMVTATLRHVETHGPVFEPAEGLRAENVTDGAVGSRRMGISDADFDAVLGLAEPLYLHATHVLSFLQPTEVRNRNLSDQERLLAAMPARFSRREWAERAMGMRVPLNTAYSWLQRLQKRGRLGREGETYIINARMGV